MREHIIISQLGRVCVCACVHLRQNACVRLCATMHVMRETTSVALRQEVRACLNAYPAQEGK